MSVEILPVPKYVVYSENRVLLPCPGDDDDYDDPVAPVRRKRFCKHYSRSLTNDNANRVRLLRYFADRFEKK